MTGRAACLIGWAWAAGLAAAPAAAQQAEPALDEILVTALRTTTDLQRTPIAVTALGPQAIADQQILSTQDLAKAVPGLILLPVTANPSTFQIGLRGGAEQTPGLIVSEPVVGIYVDDIYRGRLMGSNFQLSDIERIEVLRGPQGTLYGRNTFSGALKIITRTPGPDSSWFTGSVGGGSFDEVRGDISLGRAIGGNLGASASLFIRDQGDGWITNRATGQRVGRERNFAGRAKLAYDGGPLRIVGILSYTDDDNDGYIPVNVRFVPDSARVDYATRAFGRNAQPVVPGQPYVTSSPTPSAGSTQVLSGSLDLAADIGAVTLRSITGYVETSDSFRWDLAGGQQVAPGVFIPTFDRDSRADARQWSQELQAKGESLDGRLDWLAGFFAFFESGSQEFRDSFFGSPTFPVFRQATRTRSYALFAQANYALAPRTSVTVGLRYTTENKAFDAAIDPPTNVTANLDARFDAFTPRFGIEHRFGEELFGYLSVARGFKAGGFNGLSRSPAVLNTVYRPQTVWTYEAGLKAEAFNRRLRSNIAVFLNDISDLQQTIQRGTDFPQQNVGDARIWGVEMEVTARPIEGLDLFGSFAYTDDRYRRLDPAADAARAGACCVPLVSPWQARLGGTFEQPLSDRLLVRVGGNLAYVGTYFPVVTNALELPGWTRIDAFAALATADRRWEFNVGVQNLTDEVTYVSGIVGPPFQPALTPLRPRTFLGTVRFSY